MTNILKLCIAIPAMGVGYLYGMFYCGAVAGFYRACRHLEEMK